ncbi:HAD family hydrolase [Micromonospora taraxaci]|uniref:HAD family hydrolase n=1 Tax=Micromonospora taraxaci TaxID=1316803 RepID=UPI003C2CC3B2
MASRTRFLLLDFDGPVCDIFAEYSAPQIAQELVDLIEKLGQPITPTLIGEQDPLQVLRVTGRLYSTTVLAKVDAAFRAAECAAARTAIPTPGVDDVIDSALATGRTLIVVSNNSREAVVSYLKSHNLLDFFEAVIGRYEGMNPELLKPDRHLLDLALKGNEAQRATCVLVGDSTTDTEAAQAAGVGSIGYANKPGKSEALTEVGADAVIRQMTELATALRDAPRGW